MSTPIAIVFTGKPLELVVFQGGSASWRAVPHRARQCEFVICTRNTRAKWSDGPEDHGSAWMIGRVSGVDDAPEEENKDPSKPRYRFRFSEYALLDYKDPKFQNFWKGYHWPVHYTTLEDVGIDVAGLDWQPMPDPDPDPASAVHEAVKAHGLGALVEASYAGHTEEDVEAGMQDGSDFNYPLTLAQAKRGLALTFGISPEAIEITIRG